MVRGRHSANLRMIQEQPPGQVQELPRPEVLFLLGLGTLPGSDLEGERVRKCGMRMALHNACAVKYSPRWVITALCKPEKKRKKKAH